MSNRTDLNVIEEKAIIQTMFDMKNGPFTTGLRVGCPMKHFQKRKTEFCINCEYLKGVIQRVIKNPEAIPDTLELNQRRFGIFCSHPLPRALEIFPED